MDYRKGGTLNCTQAALCLAQGKFAVTLALVPFLVLFGIGRIGLTAIRAGDVSLIVAFDSSARVPLGRVWWDRLEELILLLRILVLVQATLPAVSPITNQELEAIGINLHAWLKADT